MTQTEAAIDYNALLARTQSLIAAGRLGAARPLLAALQKRGAPAAECAVLQATMALREGQAAAARTILDAAIDTDATHPGLRKCRAQVLSELGAYGDAARDAAEALIADPADPQAKGLLGAMLLSLRHFAEARACLEEAVAGAPDFGPYAQALAAAEEADGDPARAAATLAAAIDRCPASRNLRAAAILLALRRGETAQGTAIAQAARSAGVIDARLLALAGQAFSACGRHAEASDAYTEALALGPDDAAVRGLAAAGGVLPGAARVPLPHLRAMFDAAAPGYDAQVARAGYRVPGLLRAALLRHRPAPAGARLLDLGCGTGFIAVALSDLGLAAMEGVDVAGAMLERAQEKRLYAALHRGDLLDLLRQPGGRYDFITAAEVLCYFGALAPLFDAVRPRLLPDGLFIANVETPAETDAPDPDGAFHRLPDGRYRHAARHLMAAAAASGLQVLEASPVVLRTDAGADVPGLLGVFGRRDD